MSSRTRLYYKEHIVCNPLTYTIQDRVRWSSFPGRPISGFSDQKLPIIWEGILSPVATTVAWQKLEEFFPFSKISDAFRILDNIVGDIIVGDSSDT